MSEHLIETRGLCKQFAGFHAVQNVDLRVRNGHIHALIGPNGAGKTTCFNLLTKALEPSSGTIYYDGKDITKLPPAEVALMGMVRSFQISAIFPTFTVKENVCIALQRKLGLSMRFWQSDHVLASLDEQCMGLLESVGLMHWANHTAGELPYGRKRALEIATTLALEPKMLLLDEPTAGMGLEDVQATAALIKRASKGRTVLMVEHNLGVVSDLADRITVLAEGRILAEGTYAEVSRNEHVRAAYIGKKKHAVT